MSSADHPLIRMLAGFEARVLELTSALAQTSTADGAKQPGTSEPRATALRIAACRRLWFSEPVPLDAFLHPGNRIAILAPAALRRVLAARALIRCQDGIRRCIDRDRRRALALAVGDEALAELQDRPAATACADPLPDDLAPDVLAHRGWQMISGDGACGNATLGNIVELSLARAAGGERWQRMLRPGADRAARAGVAGVAGRGRAATPPAGESDTSRFFSMAGDLFPEFQWLFG
jgi:Bacterial type III secretion protein (HrpB4)